MRNAVLLDEAGVGVWGAWLTGVCFVVDAMILSSVYNLSPVPLLL